MIMKSVCCLLLSSFLASVPAGAQVIEIGSDGESATYAGPTIFSGEAAVPIKVAKAETRSTLKPADLIATTARDHGLQPGLLEAVAWQESRGQMNAVSVKGARGVMQLMPGTAAELGVQVDDLADNIRGGALYLRRQLDRFGSVPLALAAYNAGPGAVLRYGGIPPYRETQGYVAKIMGRWRPTASAAPATPIAQTVQSYPSVIEVPSL